MLKYRALKDMSLRRSPDKESPDYERWHEWKEGQVFTPPPHMDLERAKARGLIEKVGGNEN